MTPVGLVCAAPGNIEDYNKVQFIIMRLRWALIPMFECKHWCLPLSCPLPSVPNGKRRKMQGWDLMWLYTTASFRVKVANISPPACSGDQWLWDIPLPLHTQEPESVDLREETDCITDKRIHGWDNAHAHCNKLAVVTARNFLKDDLS